MLVNTKLLEKLGLSTWVQADYNFKSNTLAKLGKTTNKSKKYWLETTMLKLQI